MILLESRKKTQELKKDPDKMFSKEIRTTKRDTLKIVKIRLNLNDMTRVKI